MAVQVLFCSIVSWINTDDNQVKYWDKGGDFGYFKKVAEARDAGSVAGKLDFKDWSGIGDALFMFLFVDFMDKLITVQADVFRLAIQWGCRSAELITPGCTSALFPPIGGHHTMY